MADQTESSIVIAADPAAVMAVIADLEAYPQWSNGVKEVEVLTRYEDGLPGDARFVVDSGPVKGEYELGYEWDGDRAVTWSLNSGSLFKALDGGYELTPGPDGTTVVYRLTVDLAIPMIGLIKRKAERAIVETALSGLKSRVESGA